MQRLFYANKRISYFFPLRCFLSLINLMSMNFTNKQISYFFPLRCFLSLINLKLMNLKLMNLMSMNFKLINLMLINLKLINLMLMNLMSMNLNLSAFCAFLYLWNLIIKKIKFKTGLITSFILLLNLFYHNLFQ